MNNRMLEIISRLETLMRNKNLPDEKIEHTVSELKTGLEKVASEPQNFPFILEMIERTIVEFVEVEARFLS